VRAKSFETIVRAKARQRVADLRKHKVIEQKLEKKLTPLDGDTWLLAVRFRIPTSFSFVKVVAIRRT